MNSLLFVFLSKALLSSLIQGQLLVEASQILYHIQSFSFGSGFNYENCKMPLDFVLLFLCRPAKSTQFIQVHGRFLFKESYGSLHPSGKTVLLHPISSSTVQSDLMISSGTPRRFTTGQNTSTNLVARPLWEL